MLADDNIWQGVGSCTPPFGLALLAAVLEKKGIQCDILDAEAEHLSLNDIIARTSDDYEWIGITSTTIAIENTLEIAKSIKSAFPGKPIILGGVHPTIFHEELILEPSVDYIIRNEGEKPLLDIATGIPPSEIYNLSYKEDGKAMHTAQSPELYDVSTQPPLAYHKLPMNRYFSALGSYRRQPAIGFIASRGCPGRCTFCYPDMLGKQVRVLTARHIADEILHLKNTYGIREISFYDDTFTAIKRVVKEFCQILIDEKIDITWSCFARTDTVNLDLLKLMNKAGCHQISYGIESGSARILALLNKRTDPAKNEEAIKIAQKAGMNVRAAFMLGNPGETESDMEETIRYAIKVMPDLAIFNIATPYPGTAMYREAKEKGYLLAENWSDFDLSKPLMNLPGLSPDTVKAYYKKAYSKFYFRPAYLVRRALKIKSVEELKMNFDALRAMLEFN